MCREPGQQTRCDMLGSEHNMKIKNYLLLPQVSRFQTSACMSNQQSDPKEMASTLAPKTGN